MTREMCVLGHCEYLSIAGSANAVYKSFTLNIWAYI